MDGGWIKIYRKLLDNPLFHDPVKLAIWLYLLSIATYESSDVFLMGRRKTLLPGQLITSRASIARHFNVSCSKVERTLKLFEIEHQIEQHGTSQCRVISIVNWLDYQQIEQPAEQRPDSHRTAIGQPSDTIKKVKKDKKNKNDNITAQSDSKLNPSTQQIITLPLNTGDEWGVSQIFFDEMKNLYPAVDVMQELRSMRAWCLSNPQNRKTSRGIKRFINGWLSKAQDRAAKNKPTQYREGF